MLIALGHELLYQLAVSRTMHSKTRRVTSGRTTHAREANQRVPIAAWMFSLFQDGRLSEPIEQSDHTESNTHILPDAQQSFEQLCQCADFRLFSSVFNDPEHVPH